jgi:hypothetical protein
MARGAAAAGLAMARDMVAEPLKANATFFGMLCCIFTEAIL